MTLELLKQKLNEEPPAEEVSFLPDGARYLSIDIVRKKADELFDKWEHSNFAFNSFLFGKETFASGSLWVKIQYAGDGISAYERTMSGAATIKLSNYQNNEHFAETLKSLCIVNALSQEYVCFGKNLNAGLFSEMPDVEPAGKYVPDAIVNKKFENAILQNNAILAAELFLTYDLSKHVLHDQLRFDDDNVPFILPF